MTAPSAAPELRSAWQGGLLLGHGLLAAVLGAVFAARCDTAEVCALRDGA